MKFLCFVLCAMISLESIGQVSGTVFRDLDNDGVLDSNELPEGGVRVVAFASNGDSITQVITSTTLDGSGDNFSFSGLTLPVRLEFRNPYYLFPSKGSTGSNIRFVGAATGAADLGLQYPESICQSNPDVIVPCFVSGDPEGGGTGGSMDALVRFAYNTVGQSTSPTRVASASEIGTVWGSALQRETKKLVLASFLKRHCGLESLGLGGLFTVDLNTPPGTVAPYINIENFGINLGSSALAGRTLPASATNASLDPLSFDNVGKIGMGSIDFNDDGSVLWGVNLHTRQIFSFQIGNPIKPTGSVSSADFESFNIPDPNCTNGVARPWALEFYQGKVYIGVVCTAESAGGAVGNMFAYVYEFDPVTEVWNNTPVASFSLDYPKGYVHVLYPLVARWEPWTSTWSGLHTSGTAGTPPAPRKMRPQPMLTDIQFDKRGDLVLGFCDRTGHQTGRLQYQTAIPDSTYNGYIGGDILKLKATGTGTFTLENNGSFTGGPTGSGVGNTQGPGGGEFFGNDWFDGILTPGDLFTTQIHQETYMGGLFYHPGQDEIMANVIDPFNVWSGGTSRHRVSDGFSTEAGHRYQIYNTLAVGGTFGKANGLGLLDMICDPTPLQLGYRIWMDSDADGIQDAGEMGLSGVTVHLYEGSTMVGTATTDGNGYYVFDASIVTGGVKYKTNYQIRVDPNQSAFTNKILTGQNVGTNDGIDNDASESGGMVVVDITTGQSGENNFNPGIGFRNPPFVQGPISCGMRIDSLSAYQNSNVHGRVSSTQSASVLLGGERDMNFVPNVPISQTSTSFEVGPYFSGGTALDIANQAAASSTLTVQWDGIDNDPVTLNATGLGGLNFSALNINRIRAELLADFPSITNDSLPIRFELYTNSGAASSIQKNFKFPTNTLNIIEFEFSQLVPFIGAGVDLSDIGAVVMFIDMGPNAVSTRTGWDVFFRDLSLECAPCVQPSSIVLGQTAPTCTGATANNNGNITLTAVTNADKFGVSTGASYSGTPNYAGATAIGALPQDLQTAIPNTGGMYTIRFFNGADDCFTDTTITVAAVTCAPVCALNLTSDTPLCHANGTPELSTDDFITFSVTVLDAANPSTYFTVTATQGGNPITVQLANGNPPTAIGCGLITPLRTPSGTAGNGDIVITVTSNVTGCTEMITITDPGTCAVTCTPGTPAMVMYSYRTQFNITDLDLLPIIIPKFDDQGGTRTLISAKLDYEVGLKTAMVHENRAVNPQSFRANVLGDAFIDLSGSTIATASFAIPGPLSPIAAGILVPAQGSWSGDALPPLPSVQVPSTLQGMEPWMTQENLMFFKDPRTDSRWVTTATGNPTHDDDIVYYPPATDTELGSITYNTPGGLAPFIGSGNLPLTASTLTGLQLIGGGGNITSFQATRAYAAAKVTYTYECAVSCITPSAITLNQIAPTCTGSTPNNNGKVTLTAVTNADKFGVSTGATYSGSPNYTGATMIGALPQDLQTAIPNTGGTYTIRLFNGADDCFKDTTITVAPVTCVAPCAIVVTSATPSACVPATNTYSLDVIVTYSNPPSGNITITTNNGGTISVAQTTSPQTITLTGLTSNGVMGINVTAVFAAESACTNTFAEAYDAPVSCSVTPCPVPNCGTAIIVKD